MYACLCSIAHLTVLKVRLYATLQLKVQVSDTARELTLTKCLGLRVFKKSFFNKFGSSKKGGPIGTGIRYQVPPHFRSWTLFTAFKVVTSFPKFDDVLIAEQESVQGGSLSEQYRNVVESTRELLKTDKLKQELAMQQKVVW